MVAHPTSPNPAQLYTTPTPYHHQLRLSSPEQNPESELEPHEYLGPYQTKGSADLSYHPVTLTRMFELYLHKYASEADWLMLIDDVCAALQPGPSSPDREPQPPEPEPQPRPESSPKPT